MPYEPPGLVFEMTYTVRTIDPLGPSAGSPLGAKQYWKVSEATLTGSRIDANLAGAGMDWMSVGSDGYWRPNVQAQFLTSDDAIVFMRYSGLVQQTERFAAAADADEPTDWSDQYMRLTIGFETGAPQYGWLNCSLFIAKGRLLGRGHIEYAVFRVL